MREQTVATLTAENEEITAESIVKLFGELESRTVRNRILDGEPRIDGRDNCTVRRLLFVPNS